MSLVYDTSNIYDAGLTYDGFGLGGHGGAGPADAARDTIAASVEVLGAMTTYAGGPFVNTYDIGDVARLSATFTASSGSPTNPTDVELSVIDPEGIRTTPAPTSVGGGIYRYDLPITKSGRWAYRWDGTGLVEAAEEGAFLVRRREVPAS